MTSEKIFYATLAVIFAGIAVAAQKVTGQPGFGVLFGAMSFLSLIATLNIKEWFD